jgi:hypothetical protein
MSLYDHCDIPRGHLDLQVRTDDGVVFLAEGGVNSGARTAYSPFDRLFRIPYTGFFLSTEN